MAIVSMTFIPQIKIRSSPLTVVCGKNHLQVAELLINNGANINYKDGVSDNYCNHGFQRFLTFNIFSQYGRTPLHRASKEGHPELVKLLVQSHANVNVKNNVSSKSSH